METYRIWPPGLGRASRAELGRRNASTAEDLAGKNAAPAPGGESATVGDPGSEEEGPPSSGGEPAKADDPERGEVANDWDATVETLTDKQRQELRQEARSVYHLSCHKPKNP